MATITSTTRISTRVVDDLSKPKIQANPLLRRISAFANGTDRPAFFFAAASVALLVGMFLPSLVHMVYTWSTDENYGHGFLVPLLSLYFANEASRREEPLTKHSGTALAIVLLTFCILGRLATTLVPIGIICDLAFVAGLAGIVCLVGGRATLQRYGFALLFLLFMIPLPIALYSAIASPLQRLVSQLGSQLLTMLSIPVLCQGNMMTLPGGLQLFVAEACSGMRQLTGFLALTTAVAWLTPRPTWYRLTLVLSSIPVALVANVLRVTLTAWLAYAVDPALARGQFHTIEGILMLGFGLALLAAECTLLNFFTSDRRRPSPQPSTELPA